MISNFFSFYVHKYLIGLFLTNQKRVISKASKNGYKYFRNTEYYILLATF